MMDGQENIKLNNESYFRRHRLRLCITRRYPLGIDSLPYQQSYTLWFCLKNTFHYPLL